MYNLRAQSYHGDGVNDGQTLFNLFSNPFGSGGQTDSIDCTVDAHDYRDRIIYVSIINQAALFFFSFFAQNNQ